jgi:hypothetical protein
MMRRLVTMLLVLTCLIVGLPAAWAEADRFHMGFYLPGIRDANLADVRVSLQLWAEEIGNNYGFKARAFMYQDLRDMRRDLLENRIDLIIAPGMEMAENFSLEELGDGFTGYRRGVREGLALIVARPARVERLADLRGKRLVRLEQDRLSDVYLETLCLKEAGAPCAEWLSVSEEKRDAQSIHKVFFGKADAALVRLSALSAAVELNPQIAARVHTLREWKTLTLSFGLLGPRVAPEMRERMTRAGLEATKTPRGRQILEIFKNDYMDRVNKTDLEPFWHLSNEYRALTRTRQARKK